MTFIYTIKHIALYTGTLTICCVWKCHLKVATIWFCLFLCLIIDTDNVFSLFIFNFFFFFACLERNNFPLLLTWLPLWIYYGLGHLSFYWQYLEYIYMYKKRVGILFFFSDRWLFTHTSLSSYASSLI